jgi:hypothetical protein
MVHPYPTASSELPASTEGLLSVQERRSSKEVPRNFCEPREGWPGQERALHLAPICDSVSRISSMSRLRSG